MSKCEECGKEFHASRETARYCSQSCRLSVWKRNNPKKEKLKKELSCLNCGSIFHTSDFRKKFCKPDCNVAYQNAQRPTTKEEERTCPICETVFKPLQKRGVGRMCCSDICTLTWRKGEAAAERARRKVKKQSQKFMAAWCRKDRKDNPDKYRDQELRKHYGITLDEYNQMHEEQNGVCAICGKPEVDVDKRTGKTRRLAVDHHHDSGKVRKLLCARCNQGIGNLKEDPEILRKALEYLS